MMRIKVLPQTLINQIAAGEVIVRMASVVKELVENSIDADARTVDIAISNSARDLDLRDDGSGMSRDDAELSLQRHATSKIRTIEDLFNLSTRGFRGEALASIAAVSRMELQTRPRDADEGTRITVEGGVIHRIEPFGCPSGTRLLIRDLFFNTPARLKFLKTPVGEMNAVLGIVTRQALAAPWVGVRLSRDGEELFAFPPGQSPEDRFASILGSALKAALVPFHHEHGDVRVHGFIAPPDNTRGDRRQQFLFVNGRPFSSKSLGAALEQAFQGFLMVHRHPMAAVFVEVPAGTVDFNVHPTKEEVRFEDERRIASVLYHGVRDAVQRGAGRGVEATLGGTSTPPAPDSPPSNAALVPAYFTSPGALVQRAFERKGVQRDFLIEAQRTAMPAPTVPSASRSLITIRHHDQSAISAGPGEVPDDDLWLRSGDVEPIGQVARTYIIARAGEDLLLVDQHAAHERIVYLQLARQPHALERQTLLVPVVIEVPAELDEVVREGLDTLAVAGFEAERFGPRTWSVRTVPADLGKFDVTGLFLDLLGDLAEDRGAHSSTDRRDRILIRTACHAAIRAGQDLPHTFMLELLQQMRRERLSFTCPHGRPTVVRLSKNEMDRLFRRVH